MQDGWDFRSLFHVAQRDGHEEGWDGNQAAFDQIMEV